MTNLRIQEKSLLISVSCCVIFFALLQLPLFFLKFYTLFISIIIFAAFKLKDRDTAFIAILALIPFLLEMLVFDLGIVSLSSDDENRLFQNTLIFSVQFAISLIALVPMVLRVEIQSKIWPYYEPKMTLADSVFPYSLLVSSVIIFCALIENYLRNGLGHNIRFFYDIFDITGYFILSISATILTSMVIESHKEYKLKKLPSLKKRIAKN